MESKLNLDQSIIEKARNAAKIIAEDTQQFIDQHTTVTVERTIARLLGIDGVDEIDKPLPNVVVDNITEGGGLSSGTAYWIGNAIVHTGKGPQEIAEMVARGELDLTKIPVASDEKIQGAIQPLAEKMVERIGNNRKQREAYIEKLGEGRKPYLYVIVATGNIYEDVLQAQAAARQGADVIAVIRTTAQSLLDYVPYGPTTEGFGGTYATQENFRIMRKALDEVGEEIGRYIRLCNYCSGLCMPEIAAMGAIERLDVMLNDALYGILFRDINMQRTLIDQYFSRIINGFAGIIINTGEDNYLTTADAVEEAHTVLASQFINEQFALKAGIPEEQMGLGHAFEMDPDIENGFLLELAQAQMAREIFPKAPLKYMPPTKFKTGNIFKGHIQDAMFNMISVMTSQGIQLLGMLTEAIHTPLLQDRALSIENAKYVFNNARALGEDIEFKKDGIMQRRAQEVLAKAAEMLEEIQREGLFTTIEQGKFAGVKRAMDGGKGLQGVTKKHEKYFNPFVALMLGGER
ncbi:beta-lysine 5,6-aminomutase alpha subunit /D-lysine 5,6-aminomutase alpha subunit [Geosporobacter subterraneus DSM 17957]|uniref:Beta-lysine 5,6-aminomutase alpha subunit /D-lysine 5,6-aminomutase alpha subunit n=1 Tax=Geosporobacter subterraneus DSM 17957 TaxID=1121919 RepID=A0A1M6LJY8_9FIRM|nr:lysine 5,6-aminomutase subunit alpha [Geosporobacter subterraneus]SHJ71490.1 beta-lysine 5,6-aminomutase alpha subunit /D-lysine 5,6-aminomutase alpha subunit [Geosporobacter subterraneus DSM 17957]